ncbi:MAG: hypothetical protein NT069_04800 [Planctomycetota bacterium]|nr:hypothetical protein [Planctomycetota bacterium]
MFETSSPPLTQRPPAERRLRWALRILGGLDFLAVAICFLPLSAIERLHQFAGLGPFPAAPIAGYLARNVSAMYAAHGLTLCHIAGDIPRYRQLIQFLAIVAMAHGGILIGIDMASGLPVWWILTEGPGFATLGGMIWALERGCRGTER